ncbi:argus [Carabus blaptoides fortunei]
MGLNVIKRVVVEQNTMPHSWALQLSAVVVLWILKLLNERTLPLLMSSIRDSAPRRSGWSPPRIVCLLLLFALVTHTYGGCEFPGHWSGRWFQSGVGILQVNRTSIETKGECYDNQGDKFLIYDRSEDCYRCMVVHEKHTSVLQYKETYCDQKASLTELCYTITGDAALYSMFRKSPEPRPVPCPFKAAPFTFTYNRGSGECANPPSRAESCTDDSRLVLKYQACPDIESTESNVEELVCVATWKEGSTRYLVGRLNQVSRRSSVATDEDQYRCFVYERVAGGSGSNRVTYHVAQSGDATCNGLQNVLEGSRTIRLTTADSHHGRCRFPSWITDHHTWLSLDHSRTYKFSLRNATLRITTAAAATAGAGGVSSASAAESSARHHHDMPYEHHSSASGAEEQDEVRVVCHSILSSVEQRRVQIVAHVTAGCDSGYVCMMFHKRDNTVIEIQQSDGLYENTDDACRYFDPTTTPYTTLIAPALHPSRCPHWGRYTVQGTRLAADAAGGGRKRRRQAPDVGGTEISGPGPDTGSEGGVLTPPECLSHDYEALAIGCGSATHDTMDFKSPCPHQPISAYFCHGSWQENNTHYLIASPVARKSTDALRYCLVYTFEGPDTPAGASSSSAAGALTATGAANINTGAGGAHNRPPTERGASALPAPPPHATMMRLSGLYDTCHRHIVPGKSGLWAFNFTTNGGCSQSGETGASSVLVAPALNMLLTVLVLTSSVDSNIGSAVRLEYPFRAQLADRYTTQPCIV